MLRETESARSLDVVDLGQIEHENLTSNKRWQDCSILVRKQHIYQSLLNHMEKNSGLCVHDDIAEIGKCRHFLKDWESIQRLTLGADADREEYLHQVRLEICFYTVLVA